MFRYHGINFQDYAMQSITVFVESKGKMLGIGGLDHCANLIGEAAYAQMSPYTKFDVRVVAEESVSYATFVCHQTCWTLETGDVGRHLHWQALLAMLNKLNKDSNQVPD